MCIEKTKQKNKNIQISDEDENKQQLHANIKKYDPTNLCLLQNKKKY